MKKLLLFLLVFLITLVFPYKSSSKTHKLIKVAVIDTGFDFHSTWPNLTIFQTRDREGYQLRRPKLCKSGHKDFTGTGIQDHDGHGTNISGIIAKIAYKANYCIVEIKCIDKDRVKGNSLIDSINYATKIHVDIMNMSLYGHGFNPKEYEAIENALNHGIKIVAAAGNDGKYESMACYPPYPALYDKRIYSVKSLDWNGKLSSFSTYGPDFNSKEVGDNVLSLLPDNMIGRMSGTSQATAVKTAKLINSYYGK